MIIGTKAPAVQRFSCSASVESGRSPDYPILGGGIIGCSLARELVHTGARAVVERGRIGGEASSAATGVL